MNDRAEVILRLLGATSLLMGFLLAYYALTTSPSLYPPVQASYAIVGVVMGGAGFMALVSKYDE
ncbi:MAG: hypothetical protein ABSG92_09655 [Conexivisphaerales archaeon]